MPSGPESWLSFWESLATVGFVLVILGVFIEGVEHFVRFPKREQARKHRLEKLGWFILVIGLALEFLADHKAKRIADDLNSELHARAGKAEQVAAESNKEAVALRLKAAELEDKLQPRRITLQQVTNFMFLTEKVAKIPIKIHMGADEGDTGNYAYQLRTMLTIAGFKTDSSAKDLGITRDPTSLVWRSIGAKPDSPFVLLVCNSTNTSIDLYKTFEITNGFRRPIVAETNASSVYAAILGCFNQIGIPTEFASMPAFVQPGEFELFVPPKSL